MQLNRCRCIFIIFLSNLTLYSFASGAELTAYEDYARLLKTYVKNTGVKYKDWYNNKNDVEALRQVINDFSYVEVESLTGNEQKAFYINLYNAATLQAILDNYPLQSVTEILPEFGIFKKKWITLGEAQLSLDEIEKWILLKKFPDARIHFALNCASRSCPPLAATPFRAASLEEQLDKQAKTFAHSKHAVTIDNKNKTLKFSQLFQWYANDFGHKKPAIYLNQYRKTPLPEDYKTDWIRYNWSLNTAE